MKPLSWIVVGIYIIILAICTTSTAFPAQNEFVVVANNHKNATITYISSAMDNPNPPIKMTEMRVNSEIALRYAHTSVKTQVENPSRRVQEVEFRMLLPETAFITGFTMTLAGKSYKAYVKEKEEAKQIYTQAVNQGVGAAHVTTKARDSNHFTVTVNVEGQTTAIFELTYEEFLVRRNGLYNHAINLHPGSVVPKMEVVVHIKESQKITMLRVPEVRSGNEVDATENDAQNSKAVIRRSTNAKEVTITFAPDMEEQRRLIDIYTEKAKEGKSSSEKYIGFSSDEDGSEDTDVLGQFVVQYDVDRTKNSEILVNDGYFVHFLAPSSITPMNKHVVFVLDTSGSMTGIKIDQLRKAMEAILTDLKSNDYFSIVEFKSEVMVHQLKEALEESSYVYNPYYESSNTELILVPPAIASPENVSKARVIVSRLSASGGTNIYSALEVALQLVKNGVNTKKRERRTSSDVAKTNNDTAKEEMFFVFLYVESVIAKAGIPQVYLAALASLPPMAYIYVGTSADTNSKYKNTKNTIKEYAIISYFLEHINIFSKTFPENMEAMIIFLTDGDPTMGETSTARITTFIAEKNSGPLRAPIYTLAVGDADRSFLRKLSLRNDGFMRHIYVAADTALQLRNFYRQVSSPLLAHVRFLYPREQIKEGSVSNTQFRAINAGSEVAVVGKVARDITEFTPQVLGFGGNEDGIGNKRYEESSKVTVNREKDDHLPLERLWAYLTVKQLLDKHDASDDISNDKDSPEKKALAIALKYSFVTPLTSLVVVKPNETKSIDVESVDKPANDMGSGYSPFTATQAMPPFNTLGSLEGETRSISRRVYPGYSTPRPFMPFIGPPNVNTFQSLDGVHDEAYVHRDDRVDHSKQIRTIALFKSSRRDLGSEVRRDDPGSTDDGRIHFGGDDLKQLRGPGYGRRQFGTTENGIVQNSVTKNYNLQDFDWVLKYIDSETDSIIFARNLRYISLNLATDINVPRDADGDRDCFNNIVMSEENNAETTETPQNVCVYLTRCNAARFITIQEYANSYCLIQNRYAGVCCPKDEVD